MYAVDLFQDAGFGEELSKLLAGFNNLSYMFSVIFAVYTLDRFGRRCKSCHCMFPSKKSYAYVKQQQWSGVRSAWL